MTQKTSSNMLAEERTLLAAERTFSAWLRTALAAMAGGLAIIRLVVFKTELHRLMANVIGDILILWGGLVIVMASIDYKKIRDRSPSDKRYKASGLRFFALVLPPMVVTILLIWLTIF